MLQNTVKKKEKNTALVLSALNNLSATTEWADLITESRDWRGS